MPRCDIHRHDSFVEVTAGKRTPEDVSFRLKAVIGSERLGDFPADRVDTWY